MAALYPPLELESHGTWTIGAALMTPPGPSSIVVEGVGLSLSDEEILTEFRFQNVSLVHVSDAEIQTATIHVQRLQRRCHTTDTLVPFCSVRLFANQSILQKIVDNDGIYLYGLGPCYRMYDTTLRPSSGRPVNDTSKPPDEDFRMETPDSNIFPPTSPSGIYRRTWSHTRQADAPSEILNSDIMQQ